MKSLTAGIVATEAFVRLPSFRIRTLMFMVWISALACVGVADVIRERAARNRVLIIDERVHPNGTLTMTILHSHSTFWYVGPLPVGPCPAAVLSGFAAVVSIIVFIARRNRPVRSDQGAERE
jgi:hypothetical protein